MPMFCVVYGCSNRSNRERNKSFYRVPKIVVHKGEKCRKLTEERRKTWLSNLHLRSGKADSDNARVCSDHFVKGCPSALNDVGSVDWAPTVSLGTERSKPTSWTSRRREGRTKMRDQQRRSEGAEALLLFQQTAEAPGPQRSAESSPSEDVSARSSSLQDASCQTDLTMDDIERMEGVLKQTTTELGDLWSKALDSQFSQESFEKNEYKTKFYTGLPNFLVLMKVFKLCEPCIACGPLTVLSKFEQFILVLMRLRLNLPLRDLALKFNISYSAVSRVWHTLIAIIHERTEFLIEWPERHVIEATMPMVFRQAFGCRVAVIIDCVEVFIERPSNLRAREQTWSNCKHHHTVKFLIAVSPQGHVSYISRAWGGSVSDKQIIEESGLLKKLLPGDIVLADRGFNIGDSVGLYCPSLQMLALSKGERELSTYEVEQTRKIANVQSHVKGVIGLVQRKYQILQSKAMSIEDMATKQGESLSLIDKIGVICCALSNLSESVVLLE